MTNERLKELQAKYLEKPCAEPLRSDIAELIEAATAKGNHAPANVQVIERPKKSPSKQATIESSELEGH